MFIKKINSRHRRDIFATYRCEWCGWEKDMTGYDDEYYHQAVVPDLVCKQCEKKAPRPRGPKYPEGVTI